MDKINLYRLCQWLPTNLCLLHHKIDADDESGMAVKEVVAPEVDVPVLEGVVESGSRFRILIQPPGVDGTYHGGEGPVVFQGDGVAQILVVEIGIVGTVVNNPPGVRTPEQTAVACDGTVQVESRREVGEPETVVEIE